MAICKRVKKTMKMVFVEITRAHSRYLQIYDGSIIKLCVGRGFQGPGDNELLCPGTD